MELPAEGKIGEAVPATPERLDPWLSIPRPPQESAQGCNRPDYLAGGRHRGQAWGERGEHGPLGWRELAAAITFRVLSRQVGQPEDAQGHHTIERRCSL